jgi:multidrug transporter EmrE-like cation transporter
MLMLKVSEGMTRLWPTVFMLAFFLADLLGLSLALRRIPIGTAYAVWSGIGTLLVALIGVLWFKEPVTAVRLVCTGLVIAGVSGLYLTGVGW